MEKEYIFAILIVVVLAIVVYWYFYMRIPLFPDNTGINDVALSSQWKNLAAEMEKRHVSLSNELLSVNAFDVWTLPELLGDRKGFPSDFEQVTKPYGTINFKISVINGKTSKIVRIKLHPNFDALSSLEMLSALLMMPQTIKIMNDNSFIRFNGIFQEKEVNNMLIPRKALYEERVATLRSSVSDPDNLNRQIDELEKPIEISTHDGESMVRNIFIILKSVVSQKTLSRVTELYINRIEESGIIYTKVLAL